jgi:hypothetical protein
VPRRIPAPPGKTPVATADIPAWVYTFTVADDFDRDAASSEELRAAYQEWEAAVRDWRATHETPSVEELLADPVAMADAPFDPAAEIEAGTL